jgi:ribonuclease D
MVTCGVRGRHDLAGLVEEVLALELPKPQAVRLGDWERRPLTLEQQRYAAMDAYACLLLHWELQALPTTATLSQQLRAVMRERAAAAAAAGDEGAL